MKKETVPVAVGALILGFVLGIAFPKLFPDKPQQVAHTQDDGHDHSEQQPPPEVTDEQVVHALEQYKKMLEKDPNNKDIYVSMGNLCYDSDRYQQAVEYYQKALEIDPSLTDAHVDMGTMYRKLGQPTKAVKVLHEAISRNPSHPVARLNLGIILKFDLKDYHLATSAFEGFLKIAPDHPQAKLAKQFIEEMAPKLGPKAETEKPSS
jgi:tetratricopeptide (TPR) repeat protein